MIGYDILPFVVFLHVAHGDIELLERYRDDMSSKIRPRDLALVDDKISVAKGLAQKYGAQYIEGTSGENEFYEILDKLNVDTHRMEVGLQPIEYYAKQQNIKWHK